MAESAWHERGVTRRALLSTVGVGLAGSAGCLARGEDSGLEGEINIDGSNTVLPHSAAVAEEFQWQNNRVQIPVQGSGTGAGFQRFCTGETDIQNASREILPEEEELAAENGIEYLEIEALLDGIAVWANPENDWCDCLTVEELNAIWESGSTVETWSDVRDEWPDEEIALYGRDSASGTFDYFTEAINGEYGNIRTDYSESADTNVIVRGVRGNQYALGFGGAGYYYENEDDLKLLGVDDGEGCVRPTTESIEDESYTPLSRPMYVYLRRDQLTREEFRAFARFYFEEDETDDEGLTYTQTAARSVGFYAIPEETVEESSRELEDTIEEVQ
ncbi:PstS family phosphate ABC transporter substrate-binding protein [Halalkalicoccus tibetensis]|uniref:PstS family phosphate ABC transporter substrate-binding protein n=1 Tax=Halalkalicoccus tibetensis TaxID=175632 RepID=A0ABD5UWT6_9EURY